MEQNLNCRVLSGSFSNRLIQKLSQNVPCLSKTEICDWGWLNIYWKLKWLIFTALDLCGTRISICYLLLKMHRSTWGFMNIDFSFNQGRCISFTRVKSDGTSTPYSPPPKNDAIPLNSTTRSPSPAASLQPPSRQPPPGPPPSRAPPGPPPSRPPPQPMA